MYSTRVKAQAGEPAAKTAESGERTAAPSAMPTRLPRWTAGWDNRPPTSLFIPPSGIQAKREISQPGDRYEQEADRVAEQVMRMPDPAASGTRRCACGGIVDASGECPACQARRLGLQRRSADTLAATDVPASVRETIHAPGQPLDAATRAFMEARFGHDFGGVRVHTDGTAARSARAVRAHAYTVGQDVVFAAGKYAPETDAGKHLLAHELTHTIQQGRTAAMISTQQVPAEVNTHAPEAMLSRAWEACGSAGDCPPRQAGEYQRARAASLQTGTLEAPEHGFIISHFNISSADASSLARNAVWQQFVSGLLSEQNHWEILGFSDCQGEEELNTTLRAARATAVYNALPAAAQARITRQVAAPLSDCVAGNDTEEHRSYNRAVVFKQTETFYTFPDEQVQGQRPRPPRSGAHVQDCNEADTNTIHRAVRVTPTAAAIAANAILARPRSATAEAALTRYFGSSGPSRAASIALRLLTIGRALSSATIECENPGSVAYNFFCGTNLAYVRPIPAFFGLASIHVCQPGFRNLSPVQQVATLVHEGAHRYIGASDNAYYTLDCDETRETRGLSDNSRWSNADSYGCLVQAILNSLS